MLQSTSIIRVVQIGLGPIGVSTTRYLLEHPRLRIVGALDSDPAKQGKDLGELAGVPSLGLPIGGSLDDYPPETADTAVVTTTSSLERLAPLLRDLTARQWNTVSSCEELSFPWLRHPELSRELDGGARKHDVSILGTGINPGFLMDLLPLALTGISQKVERIAVERVQDAGLRRVPFQHKIGAGLDAAQFKALVAKGLMGHVGLTESMQMVAQQLGWRLDRTTDEIEPILASGPVTGGDQPISEGKATGLLQTGRGFVGKKEVIHLLFRASVGEPRSFDRIRIEGIPNLDFVAEGGINGDVGTIAVLVNSIPRVQTARAGLLTMPDLAPVTWFGGTP